MADIKELIEKMHERDMKLIMDLVPNHTSSRHKWFQESRKSRDNPYSDYYYWFDPPPNDWQSMFGGSAYQYDELRGQYYLRTYAVGQPDLNWENPKVVKEMQDVVDFWVDLGVDGFRCDVINILYKDSLESSKKKLALTGSEHYLSLEGTHEILRELRKVLDEYEAFTVGETVFVTPKLAHDLCDEDRKELNMVFSFEHMECDQIGVKWFKTKFKIQIYSIIAPALSG